MRGSRFGSVLATVAMLAATTAVVGAGDALAAPGDPSVRFTASGDFSSTPESFTVLSTVGSIQQDLHLALGDLSYGTTGNEPQWCDLVTARVGAGFPFELVAGNHESNGQNGNINDFSACLPNQVPGVVGTYGREYFVDVPADAPLVRFIAISPGLTFPGGSWSYASGTPHYQWTVNAIDQARTAGIPWVVVGMHKPCLSLGRYVCDPGPDVVDLLLETGVDLVVTGHEHLYQRTRPLALGPGCPRLRPGRFTAACVAGDGAGTSFVTVGTGGHELRVVNGSDSERRFFAASSGRNEEPSFGSLDVQVTAHRLSARFVPVDGGTFTDRLVLTR